MQTNQCSTKSWVPAFLKGGNEETKTPTSDCRPAYSTVGGRCHNCRTAAAKFCHFPLLLKLNVVGAKCTLTAAKCSCSRKILSFSAPAQSSQSCRCKVHVNSCKCVFAVSCKRALCSDEVLQLQVSLCVSRRRNPSRQVSATVGYATVSPSSRSFPAPMENAL